MDLPHQGEQADSSEFCDAAFANSFSAGVGVSGDAIEGAPAKESAGVIPKGFRARWRAKSQSKAEAASDERQVSDYQSQSPSLASWDEVEPVIKKPRTQSASSSVAHLIQEQTVGEVQRIADVARLEALQRFRTHDIKMPWEKGPLAPIFWGTHANADSIKELGHANGRFGRHTSPFSFVQTRYPGANWPSFQVCDQAHSPSQMSCT